MIGRKKEQKDLKRLYNSGKAELVAVYGRRRVGKTYLISETFDGKITFHHTGLSPEEESPKGLLRAQLDHFCHSLELQGFKDCSHPDNWLDAFFLLEKHLQTIDDGSRQLVFLDELPWLDSPRSGFIQAFEAFWNGWGCYRKNLMVIICGSATSWILDNMINNHGGLYDRLTYEIKLSPFCLHECEEFYQDNHIRFSRYDIVQSYMVFGGIPYYMGCIDPELSLAQNIDNLFFSHHGKLRSEFDRLFNSVFSSPETVKTIVRLLQKNSKGYTRTEIASKLSVSDGGTLTSHLNALINSDFVLKYVPFDAGKKQSYYKLVDPFCIFYLHFMNEGAKTNEKFWQQNTTSHSVASWRGFAFENVCFNHISQIKQALGISGVITTTSAWSMKSDDEAGTQIDLLIQRNDNVINMCEIKFYRDDFTVNKQYYRLLLRRQDLLAEKVSRKYAIYTTLITTYGLDLNEYSSVFTSVVTMDDLFR